MVSFALIIEAAFLPIFTLGLALISGEGSEGLGVSEILAFALLLSGTVLITWEKGKNISLDSIKIAVASALFLALFFFTAKVVYLEESFLSGFMWTRVGAFLLALSFIFFPEVRKDIKKPKAAQNKTWLIFLPNEAASAGAFMLQNWAVSLAPLAFLGIINALEGVKFVFVLIFATVISLKFPQILKEEISGSILIRKIIAILLIGGGLAMLSL
jgi:drug/metabolite transporter (DMT)-like permease